MIRVSSPAASRAFAAFRHRRPKWVEDLPRQMQMYQTAARAFRGG